MLHVANQIKTTSPKLIEAVKVAHFNPGQAFYSYFVTIVFQLFLILLIIIYLSIFNYYFIANTS